MVNTLFILGAGTSTEAGAPAMANFLDKAEELFLSGVVDSDKEHFELVFEGIAKLQHVYAKSFLDTNNVESVFTAFEKAFQSLFERIGLGIGNEG
jgi:hypothetical protein